MDSPRDIVRRALDHLKPYLAAYVRQHTPPAREQRAERADIAALIRTMLDYWEPTFARFHPVAVRHFLHELRDVRNRWAHEEDFTLDEAHRAADTARFVAKAIGAPPQVLDTLTVLAGRLPSSAPGTEIRRPDAQSTLPETHDRKPVGRGAVLRPPDGPATPRRDAHGVIVNAAELIAEQVALQRVLCPACEKKVFESWSFGWDAHAAHVCMGIPLGSEMERKAEYRRRYAHLFKGDGAIAAPSKQRDVMRQLCARFAPDHERVIREYADAERRGEVARAHNKSGLTPEGYARALLADGLKKGWLPG